MILIVEDGSGIFEANSYAGPGFVRSYLVARNRATEWISATRDQQNAALIASTDYIDNRFGSFFIGTKQFRDISVPAYNILSFFLNPVEDEEVTIGSETYVFKTAGAGGNEVTIGGTTQASTEALVAAINAAHPTVSATALAGSDAVLVRALVPGPLAAPIPTTSNSPNLSWDLTTLSGGQDHVSQFLEFPRDFLFLKNGDQVIGIPEDLKMAVAEYASRAISLNLMPDPEVDPTGQILTRIFEKVGPIEEDRRFVFSSGKDIFQKFPAADKLLSKFLMDTGQVIR